MNNFLEKLKYVWEKEVKSDYNFGLITNESQLQASLYYHLRNNLDPSVYKIWVETSFYFFKGEKKYADLVITKDATVLAIFELKFSETHPVFEDDLRKLKSFQSPHQIKFIYCCDVDRNKYQPETENICIIFGGIGKHNSDLHSLKKEGWKGYFKKKGIVIPTENFILLSGNSDNKKFSFIKEIQKEKDVNKTLDSESNT